MSRVQSGFSLLELIIVLTITGILLGMAVPNLSIWLLNNQIHATASAFRDGLQLARMEAIQRNAHVTFQITDQLTDQCIPSLSGMNWLVRTDNATGNCNIASNPDILQTRAQADDSNQITVTADPASAIEFNGMGMMTPAALTHYRISFRQSDPGQKCRDEGGAVRCLNIMISPAGQVRLCDPAVSYPEPAAC